MYICVCICSAFSLTFPLITASDNVTMFALFLRAKGKANKRSSRRHSITSQGRNPAQQQQLQIILNLSLVKGKKERKNGKKDKM